MASIRNMGNLSMDEIYYAVQQGGKFVRFGYCISVGFHTLELKSNVHFLRPGERPEKFSKKFNILTSVFGWCGIPYGPIAMARAFNLNRMGGENITREVILNFERQMQLQGIPYHRPAGLFL